MKKFVELEEDLHVNRDLVSEIIIRRTINSYGVVVYMNNGRQYLVAQFDSEKAAQESLNDLVAKLEE